MPQLFIDVHTNPIFIRKTGLEEEDPFPLNTLTYTTGLFYQTGMIMWKIRFLGRQRRRRQYYKTAVLVWLHTGTESI